MKKRRLGNSGLKVSALGMGCMNLSFGTWKAVIGAESTRSIRLRQFKTSILSGHESPKGALAGNITPDTKFDPTTDLHANFLPFTPGAIKTNMPVIELPGNIAKRK
ncbi:hypothetical protein [Dyadobacter frigoris]|uniref:Aldo/keto reductase n=1 Tax=Dyadobacter frigoris TaxID=2576211 RepID=A0A4U6CRZ6_9BACT|nr:hypothetical protein [Dyadobacter frigoris]TKT86261.1 hypothetical protein FDK13_32630 [Dyadobacter frigoris]GLU56898.1 hypothetical protein Dfri01_63590 [Dyadobacter frigoris]